MRAEWWRDATAYQIYVKSFNDTTGNGQGDIQGIIEKLDYLKMLGVDVLWLTPIYESPQNDNGYDISDYYKIDSSYGTMADFDRLLQETHKRKMKLIVDIVINHTSTEHAWFKEASSSKDNPYRDFYIWRDGVDGKEPNNWVSKFGGSAWAYDETTNQYYLHLFDRTQADLNWENEAVRNKVYDVLKFWAEKGVDGFRLDVINLISKNQQFPNDENGVGKQYYTDGPRIHEFLHEMNQTVFEPYGLMTVGEMSSTSIESCVKYTNPDRKELDMIFQFHHVKVDYPNGEKWAKVPFDFLELKRILSNWQVGMSSGGGWNALFWCNHDQPRIVSRFGNEGKYHDTSAKMLATTLHMMQGTPYVYQGEEIGMTNPHFSSIEQYCDVEALNAYESMKAAGKSEKDILAILDAKSRDTSRTPMQWSDGPQAGFTDGTPWISVAHNYRDINAKDAISKKDSIFYHYQQLIRLRKTYDVIVKGDYKTLLADHEHIFAYVRHLNGEKMLVLSNFYELDTIVNLNVEADIGRVKSVKVLLSNYSDSTTDIETIHLRPYESIVYYIL